jgi:DNA anti-recombination protein RmuC
VTGFHIHPYIFSEAMDYFDYSEAQPDTFEGTADWDLDIEEFLEQSQDLERQRLEEELQRIDQQLERREEIQDKTVDELESTIEWYKERLMKQYKRNSTKQIEELKQNIREFYRELREERRHSWRDRQQLEQERRDLFRELRELEDDLSFDLL